MPEYYIEHREAFNKPYLKVELKDNSRLAEVQFFLHQLQSIKKVNITKKCKSRFNGISLKIFYTVRNRARN